MSNPDLPNGADENAAPQPPQAPQAPQYQQQYQQAPQAPQYQQQYQQAPGAPYGEPGPGEPFDGATSVDVLTRPLYGATFSQAIRRFFKNYVNFKGRASRSEYWWVQLFLTLITLVPFVLLMIGIGMSAGGYSSSTSVDPITGGITVDPTSNGLVGAGSALMIISGILLVVIGLGTLLPSLSIIWRRLHDANFAGPFYFLTFTYVGSIVVLVFTILGSKPEGRRFDQ
ncbi:DUF805 domain-containing protein [Leucobacter salsicius]|uniref:DUF805 domain-containing protein n=1 Tax=Leucobacter salsicius TaxID=664638 RepID=UPI000346570A|nr:DUF805 domain-containing protein [Leucobacter salsicius]